MRTPRVMLCILGSVVVADGCAFSAFRSACERAARAEPFIRVSRDTTPAHDSAMQHRATLRVAVVQSGTSTPISSAAVLLVTRTDSRRLTADAQGMVWLDSLDAGPARIRASRIGYAPLSTAIEIRASANVSVLIACDLFARYCKVTA